jgi:hypothetical protein
VSRRFSIIIQSDGDDLSGGGGGGGGKIKGKSGKNWPHLQIAEIKI